MREERTLGAMTRAAASAASITVSIAATIVAGGVLASGCGLANAVAHTGHALYDDAVGVCAWCADEGDGFPCVTDDDGAATCTTTRELADCDGADALLDVADGGDDAPVLSPFGLSNGNELALGARGACPSLFVEGTADLVLAHDRLGPLDDDDDETDLEELAALFPTAGSADVFVAAASWRALPAPWPRTNRLAALTVAVCAREGEPVGFALRVALSDDEDDASNPICIEAGDPE